MKGKAKANFNSGLVATLALRVTGDLGPFTIWTDKYGRTCLCLKTWLKDPASFSQITHRNRIRLAAVEWRLLHPTTRKAWLTTARVTGARCNGYMLWSYYRMTQDIKTIKTLFRQAKITFVEN